MKKPHKTRRRTAAPEKDKTWTADELLALLGDDTSEGASIIRRFLELVRTGSRKRVRRLVLDEQKMKEWHCFPPFKMSRALRKRLDNEERERQRRLDIDKLMVDAVVKQLKAHGMSSGAQGKAETIVGALQNVTKQAIYRRRKRREKS